MTSSKADTAFRNTRWFVFAGIGLLLAIHLLVVFGDLYRPGSLASRLDPWLDLDRERNLPTAISSLFFLLASYSAARLGKKAKFVLQRAGWWFLALLFVYFALDEFLIIHEQLAEPLRKVLDISAGSPLFHAWVIPVIGLVGVLGVAILILRGYYKQLAVFTGILGYLFALAAGTVLFEILGTYVFRHTAFYRFVMIPLEEIFELSMGAILWLRLRRAYARGK